MTTPRYQLFFIIGLSMERPYNSLELWPTTVLNGMPTGEELPVQTMMARQIYEFEA